MFISIHPPNAALLHIPTFVVQDFRAYDSCENDCLNRLKSIENWASTTWRRACVSCVWYAVAARVDTATAVIRLRMSCRHLGAHVTCR